MKLTYGSLDLTAFPYSIEFGTDVGAPQNVTEALAFLLQDGEVELSSRASNRTLQFTVLVEGASLTALATNEAALILETEKALNTISLDPEDSAPVTVYETFRGQVALARDDDLERARLRRFVVTVKAAPFPRSASETSTITLPANGVTTTVLDAMSATTGWTGNADGVSATVTNGSGANTVSLASASEATHSLIMQKTFGSTATTTTKLLVLEWKPSHFGGSLTVTGDGTTLPLVAEKASATAGYVQSYFYIAASTIATVAVIWTGMRFKGTPTTVSLSLDNIAVTNTSPTVGNGRQQVRSLDVGGAVRAPANLAVEASTSLGNDVLVYVFPDAATTNGYSPPMRQFRTAGNAVTPTSTNVSGGAEDITGSGVTFTIPSGLIPTGNYVLMARAWTSGGASGTISYSGSMVLGANTLATVPQSVPITLAAGYKTYALGRLELPVVDVDPSSTSSVKLTISSSVACTLDEAWLFNTTIGQLTWVDCGTTTAAVGGPAKRLFLNAARVGSPRPTVRMGHSSDQSDSYHPVGALKSWMPPEFVPPQVNVLAVTPGATDSIISLTYYKRWHDNAAS